MSNMAESISCPHQSGVTEHLGEEYTVGTIRYRTVKGRCDRCHRIVAVRQENVDPPQAIYYGPVPTQPLVP